MRRPDQCAHGFELPGRRWPYRAQTNNRAPERPNRAPWLASSRFGPRTGIPVRGFCVPDGFAGRRSRAIPGHTSQVTVFNRRSGD